MKRQIVFILILILLFFSCKDVISYNPTSPGAVENEIFEEENKPFFVKNESEDSHMLMPWNYEKDYNSEREYPLVIYLHGSGGYGTPDLIPFLGYRNDDFKKEYPSFVYLPRFPDQWGYTAAYDELITKIENIKSHHRIDDSRIYFIGYSMGAHWVVPFLNYYYEVNGSLAAGLISQAGISDVEPLNNAVKDKIAIWIQIGEDEGYLSRSNTVYNSLVAYYAGSFVCTGFVPISGYTDSTTTTHTLNGIEVLKNTVYTNTGHGVRSFPFQDPLVLQWLFSQDRDHR